MSRWLVVMTLVLFCCSRTIGGDVKIKLDTPAIEKQKTNVWCWAASIQNVLSSYDVKVDQEEVVQATYGAIVDRPIFDPREAAINLLKASEKVAPKKKVVHPFVISGPPNPAVLVRELSREKSPLLAFYKNSPLGGHVVVCFGAEYRGNPNRPLITKVLVKDPADGNEKEWGGAQLAQLWTSTIFVRVAPEPKRQFDFRMVRYRVSPFYDAVNPDGQVEGRIWYFNEFKAWHIFNLQGEDLGEVP